MWSQTEKINAVIITFVVGLLVVGLIVEGCWHG